MPLEIQSTPPLPPPPPPPSFWELKLQNVLKSIIVTVNLNNKDGRLKRDFILLTCGKYKLAGRSLYKVLYHYWKILSVYYCAFHKHANSEVQKLTFAFFAAANHLNAPLRKQNFA